MKTIKEISLTFFGSIFMLLAIGIPVVIAGMLLLEFAKHLTNS